MSCGKSEGRCVCHLDTYIPVNLFGYWFRSVKQKVESEMSDEKKAWKGYALRLDSHISVNPCDKFFESASRKWKKMHRERTPKGGCMPSDIYFIQLLWLVVLIGQTEERKRWAVKEKLWRWGTHVTKNPYLSQLLPSIHPIGSTDEWWERCSKADVFAT